MIFCLPALFGVGQAKAVDYKGVYQPVYEPIEVPQATFQSTSAYSEQWQEGSATPMLNSDGSMNGEAYMGSSSYPRSVIRKGGTGTPGFPQPENQQPLGDGLWVLLLLAGGYILARTLRTKRAITK